MDILILSKKVISFLLPFLKSKAAKKVNNDISEAFNNEALSMWDTIKPLFIKEEIIKEIEENPYEKIIQEGFNYNLVKKLKENPIVAKELESQIDNINSPEGKSIINQTHYGSGDNVAGNKIVNEK